MKFTLHFLSLRYQFLRHHLSTLARNQLLQIPKVLLNQIFIGFFFSFLGTVNCCLGSSQTGWGYRFISWKPNRGLGFEWILGFERIFCRRRFSVPGFRLVACFLKLFPFVESIGNLRFWVLLREFHMFTERKLNLETVVIRIWTWFRRFLQITMAVWRGRQLLAGQFLIVSKFDLCMIDCLVS